MLRASLKTLCALIQIVQRSTRQREVIIKFTLGILHHFRKTVICTFIEESIYFMSRVVVKPTLTLEGLGEGENHPFLLRFYSAVHDEHDKLVVGNVEKNLS